MPRLSNKAKHLLWSVIKILILIVAGYLILTKLESSSVSQLSESLEHVSWARGAIYIFLMFLLSGVNWFLEVWKWQILVGYFEELRFRESINQTFTAHLLGFITPAKTGDYGAKTLFYQPSDRKKILFLNFIGNMYQLQATLIFGAIGLGIIALFTNGTALFFWGLSIFMGFILYQIIPKVLRSLGWTLKGNAWHKIKKFWKSIPQKLRKNVRILSLLRYAIFSHQFYILLLILGLELSYPFTMACICATYVLSSLVPVMQLFDVIVKGGVAVLVFSRFYVPEEIVLATILLMWFFNVILPLVLGGYFLSLLSLPNLKTTSQ